MVESKNMVEVTKEKKLAAATRLVELPYHLEADSVFASESVLEYQNKALASLVQKHKSKCEELQGEVQRSAAERVNLEANLAHLASKLLNTTKSLELMFSQNFAKTGPLPSLPSLLSDSGADSGLFASLRALLVAPTDSGEDAQMEDESINNDDDDGGEKNQSVASLTRSIDQALQTSMASLIAAHKQATQAQGASSKSTRIEEAKSSDVALDKLAKQTTQLNTLQVRLTKTQTRLLEAESRLAAPATGAKASSSSSCQHVGISYSQLGEKLTRAEGEIQILRLRIENRPSPYFKVVSAFFPEKLPNFTSDAHTCTCNVCCLDLEAIKQKAVEDTMAAVAAQEASRRAESGKDATASGLEGADPSNREALAGQQSAVLTDKKSVFVNSQEIQELKDQVEQLTQNLSVKDSALRNISRRLEHIKGDSTKTLPFEEWLTSSLSMKSLGSQLQGLTSELSTKENLAVQFEEAQVRIQALVSERKLQHASLQGSMAEVKKEVEELRERNRTLQAELVRVQQQSSTDQSSYQQEMAAQGLLRGQTQRLETLHQFMAVDLERNVKQCKDLNARLIAAETKAKETQKKYDESKKTYYQLQDSRSRLRTELDKLKGTKSGAGGNEGSEGMAAAVSSPDMGAGAAKPTPAEIQQKYEHLKTKYRIAEEAAKSAEKRAGQAEEESKAKDEQLEELYNQIDGMQECITQLEEERTEQQGQLSRLQTQQHETQRAKMDLEIRVAQHERDLTQLRSQAQELKGQQERMTELITNGQHQLQVKDQMLAQLETQAALQAQAIDELQKEMDEAKMAHAQAESRLLVAADTFGRLEDQVSLLKKEGEESKQKSKQARHTSGGGAMDVADDPDIAMMKYQLWKPKMTCGSCSENGNDVEIVLPCGHLLCKKCVDSIVKDRSRACPFDRRKFTPKDIQTIYWAANSNE